MQVETATLGDIVLEQVENQNTTNPQDQQAIVVELIYELLYKVKAVYRIPDEMLDIGDYVPSKLRPREPYFIDEPLVLSQENDVESNHA